ncbi:unnamed protein product [Camellia sinensis]
MPSSSPSTTSPILHEIASNHRTHKVSTGLQHVVEKRSKGSKLPHCGERNESSVVPKNDVVLSYNVNVTENGVTTGPTENEWLGDRLSGLIIDIFGDLAVIASSAAWVEKYKPQIKACISGLDGIHYISWRSSIEILKEEGLYISDSKDIYPPIPLERVKVMENGIPYLISLEGQKTGFYADQRENRQFISTISDGQKVLDMYGYSGGFALNASRGGATNVTGVDSSLPALELANENIALNNLDPGKISVLRRDATDFMKDALSRNETWDIIIMDPPKLAPRRKMDYGLSSYLTWGIFLKLMATWFMGGSGNRRGGRNLQKGDSSRRGGGRGSGDAEDETPFTLLDAPCAYHDRFGKRHFVMPKYYRDPCGLVEEPSDNQTGYGLANARLLKWPALFIERVQMERLCRENRLKVPKARSVEIQKEDLDNVDRLCERLQREISQMRRRLARDMQLYIVKKDAQKNRTEPNDAAIKGIMEDPELVSDAELSDYSDSEPPTDLSAN